MIIKNKIQFIKTDEMDKIVLKAYIIRFCINNLII
jgi:hypothetical protein